MPSASFKAPRSLSLHGADTSVGVLMPVHVEECQECAEIKLETQAEALGSLLDVICVICGPL